MASVKVRLAAAGYTELREDDPWHLEPEGRYFVTRNESALIAFRCPGRFPEGPTLIGAHTDSPALKLKPKPELDGQGLVRLAVEPYGGVLQNPWFDRDLALAGRVHFRNPEGTVQGALVQLPEKLAIIPSLAIHLDREANQKRSINAQTDLPALFAFENDEATLKALLKTALEAAGHAVEAILDHELLFYDTQGAATVGLDGAFLASARLDNLLSCFCATEALLNSGNTPALIVLNDHEEVGSASSSGPPGPSSIKCCGASPRERKTAPACGLGPAHIRGQRPRGTSQFSRPARPGPRAPPRGRAGHQDQRQPALRVQ